MIFVGTVIAYLFVGFLLAILAAYNLSDQDFIRNNEGLLDSNEVKEYDALQEQWNDNKFKCFAKIVLMYPFLLFVSL